MLQLTKSPLHISSSAFPVQRSGEGAVEASKALEIGTNLLPGATISVALMDGPALHA